MATSGSEAPLLPSVLDRLIDEAPESTRDPVRSANQSLRTITQSVRRDLEQLLNTRRRFLPWPANLKELDQSSVSYGLADTTGLDLAAARGREEFRLTVEKVIRVFEPRFQAVHVEMLTNPDQIDRTLRFRVDAVLRAEPVPIEVTFDSQLEPSTGTFHVKNSTP